MTCDLTAEQTAILTLLDRVSALELALGRATRRIERLERTAMARPDLQPRNCAAGAEHQSRLHLVWPVPDPAIRRAGWR